MSTYELEAASDEAATPVSVMEIAGFNVGNQLISDLYLAMTDYLWLDDLDAALAALATATSTAIIDGEPLWLMLVGASSGGKGETLRLLEDVVDRHEKDLTLPGLLSVSQSKSGGATGLLTKLQGANAMISISDFSAMLGGADGRSQSGATKQDLFNALRDIYDGSYSRTMHRGTAEWSGRLSMLAACTPAIDRYAAHSDSLGTRWLYFRLPDRDAEERRNVSRVATTRTGLTEKRKKARDLATEIVRRARWNAPDVQLTSAVEDLVIECGLIASTGRANVPRDYRGDIDGIADCEEPGRVTHQLRLLARSLIALDLKPEVVDRMLRRTAMSSMPLSRSRALAVLAENPEHSVTTYRVANGAGMNQKVAQRALEDWEAIGVVNCLPPGQAGNESTGYQWWLADEHRVSVARVAGTS